MVPRKLARYLAPAALVVTAVGAYLVVSAHVNSSSPPARSHLADGLPRERGRFARRRFYTVKPGENLTGISTKTGIPVPTLEQLNPSLDPNSLQTGQRLRLRR
jgi:hypothetical protein